MNPVEVNVDFIINNPEVMADAARVKSDITGVADTAEKATARVNNSIKTILSDSQAEIDAYAKSLQVATGRVADSGKNELIRLLNEDLKLGLITAKQLEEEMARINTLQFSDGPKSTAPAPFKFSDTYDRLSTEGLAIFKSLDPATQKLTLRNIELKEELAEVAAAQKELNEAFDNGAIGGAKYSSAQAALVAKEAELKSAIKGNVAEINKLGKEAEIAAARVENAGKAGFDRMGNAIDKPIGKLERLKYAAKQYEQMAATSLNPEIINKYNRKFQDTQIEIERTKNVGKQGFDELGNAIKGSTSLVGKFWGGLKLAANILPGVGIAGLLAFAAEPIINYISKLDLFKKALTQAQANLQALNEVQRSANTTAGEQISNLKILYAAATDVTKSTKERTEAAQELKKEFPQAFANSQLQAILNGEESKSFRELTAEIIENAKAKAARDKIAEVSAKRLDAEFQKEKIRNAQANQLNRYSEFQKQNEALYKKGQSLLKPGSIQDQDNINNIKNEASEAIKVQDAQLKILDGQEKFLIKFAGGNTKLASAITKSGELIKDPLKNFDSLVKNISSKSDIENIKKSLQASLDALAPNDAQIAVYQAKIRKLQEIEKKYQPKLTEGKKENTILDQRQGLLNKMADIEAEYARNSQTKDQKEIEAVKAKFAEIRRTIEEFNKKNPAKAISLVGLNKAEQSAVSDTEARQGVEQYQLEINAQKQIFDQFEAYKLEFGLQKANERFGSELKGFKDYLSYLRSLMPADADQSAKANAMRDLLNKAIPKAEEEQSKQNFDNSTKRLKKVLEETETAALKRVQIEKKYTEDVAALQADGTIGEAEKAARLQKLDETRVIALKANQQQAFEEGEFYKAAMKDVTNASLAELKQRLNEAKKLLADPNLTAAERAAVKAKLEAAEKSLGDKGFKTDQYGQLINDSSETAQNAKSISAYAAAASDSFYEMAGALKDIAPGTADTLETLGDIAGVAANAAGAVASFASGDIVGGIKGTISAIAGVFAIGAKARESERKAMAEMKEYQDGLIQGEIALNIEMRNRARTQEDINQLTRQELDDRRKLLATQASQSKSDFERQLALVQAGQQVTGARTEKYGGFLGIGRKTKTVYDYAGLKDATFDQLEALSIAGKLDEATEKLFQDLKKSKDEMDAIGDSAEDLAKTLTEKLTGGLQASDISNTIVQGLKDGKRALVDFADDTEEIIKNALLSALAYNMLSEPLKKLVAQFGEDAQDGLDNQEIKNFKDGLGTTTETFLEAAKAVEKATGIRFDSNSSAGRKSGAIEQALTEATGSELKGLWRGHYDITKEHLVVARQSQQIFREQQLGIKAIEANTGNMVLQLTSAVAELKTISANTKPPLSAKNLPI